MAESNAIWSYKQRAARKAAALAKVSAAAQSEELAQQREGLRQASIAASQASRETQRQAQADAEWRAIELEAQAYLASVERGKVKDARKEDFLESLTASGASLTSFVLLSAQGI